MDEVPSPTPTLRVRLTGGAEAALKGGHPWIYAEGIQDLNRPGEVGELAAVYNPRNRFEGMGLFDPHSPIRVRMLYQGKARPLNEAWWASHLEAALSRRAGLFDADTTGYRCINGESDGWPGLVLDRYDSTLVVKLYTAAWLPRWPEIADLFEQRFQPERIVLRLSRNLQSGAPVTAESSRDPISGVLLEDGALVRGAPLDKAGRVVFQEHGLRFEAEVQRGQKTGFFLDQRENRAQVGSLSHGREVLNTFSYSGGFSLHAARGGAKAVTDVDQSAHALASAARNFALNRWNTTVRACRHEAVQADVFAWLRESPPRDWDLVILDPPSFARKEAQRGDALKAYRNLVRGGIERLRRGGTLVAASCSAHVPSTEFFTLVRQTAKQSRRLFRELATTRHPSDHPSTFPEADYLKCIYLRLS